MKNHSTDFCLKFVNSLKLWSFSLPRINFTVCNEHFEFAFINIYVNCRETLKILHFSAGGQNSKNVVQLLWRKLIFISIKHFVFITLKVFVILHWNVYKLKVCKLLFRRRWNEKVSGEESENFQESETSHSVNVCVKSTFSFLR